AMIVLFWMTMVRPLAMPPPKSPPVFAEIVQPRIVAFVSLLIPAPLGAEFPEMVQLVRVNVPEFSIPPPEIAAELPVITQFETASGDMLSFSIPPPLVPAPPVIVNPEIVLALSSGCTVKIGKKPLPLIVNRDGPGPDMRIPLSSGRLKVPEVK